MVNKKPVFRTGNYAFMIGVAIAIFTGILTPQTLTVPLAAVLIGLGFVVGYLNINVKDSVVFLLASLVLILISGLSLDIISQVPFVGTALHGILTSLLLLVVPSTLIVALKTIFTIELRG